MKIGGGKYQSLILIIIFGFILNLAWASQVFCYDARLAHPGIADLAVKLYNQNNNKKISSEQLGWIKTGAQEEDAPTRWLNHFYDPVYNHGLNFLGQHVSAKEWSKNSKEQKNYALGDKSWPRAIDDYRRGDYEQAFKELGHNIHLVSDMLVPSHTRDDIHALPPDSYDEYVKNNWNKFSREIKGEVIDQTSLDDIFDSAAKYSNSNFYSDDTIEDKKYKINDVVVLRPYNFDKNIKLSIAQIKNSEGKILNSHILENTDWKNFSVSNYKTVNNSIILSDYAKNLLPKAIGYSANVIKLFFDETQKNQKEKLPFFRIGLNGVANYLAGTAVTVAENIYDNARAQKSTGQIDALNNTNNLINNLPNNQNINNKTVYKINSNIKNKINFPPLTIPILHLTSTQEIAHPVEPDFLIKPTPIVHSASTSPSFSYSGGGYSSVVSIPATIDHPLSLIVTNTQSVFNNTNSSVSSSPSSTNTSSLSILSPTTTTSDVLVFATNTFYFATNTAYLSTDTTSTNILTTTTNVGAIATSSIFTSTTQVVSLVTTTASTIATTSAAIIFPTSSLIVSPPTSTVASSSTIISTTSSTAVSIVTSTVLNTTTTVVTSTSALVSDIVINEIAWAGTSATTDQDEYIELYNNTDQDINLFPANDTSKWWKLMIGNQEISISKIINRIIPKNGYFLLERTDDRTVNEIPADIIYSGVLKNSGERVRLIDGNNQLVDEVNNLSGWFAGSASVYASMERINSRISSDDTQNWQTNQGPRLDGKVDGGGDDLPLNGSPKQSNFGSIVLKSRQLETERNLKYSDFPYILTYYEIPSGKILNIEAGTVIKTFYPDSKISIGGVLNVNGTSNNKVILTSGRDNELSTDKFNVVVDSRSGTPQSKDWQGLIFGAGSSANLSGLDLRYAGKAFKAQNSNMWDPLVSQAVHFDSALVNINNSFFSNNGDTTLYFSNSTSSIKNTNLNVGQLAIENYGGDLDLENIYLNNFSGINGPIYVKNIWPKISQISFNQNGLNTIFVDQASILSSTVITKEIPMLWKNITIESNATVNIESGTTIKLPPYANIIVKGSLVLNGTNSEPINLQAVEALNNYNYWGRLIFDGGMGNFANANISGGWGSIATYDGYQGMVVVNDGELSLENCQLLDSRPPGNALEINNSKVSINNSSVGYIGSKPNFENTNGIKINSGELILDNSNLMNLDTGLIAGNINILPNLQLNNMDSRNFINVKKFWDPSLWYSDFIVNSNTSSTSI